MAAFSNSSAPNGTATYPPIEKLGVIGDRRTAAMVAADGTIGWFCLPNYDSAPTFGALIDSERGGSWRLGPEHRELGKQRYAEGTCTLVTFWEDAESHLELSDTMLWPHNERSGAEAGRIILRRLHARKGSIRCVMNLDSRDDFGKPAAVTQTDHGLRLVVGPHELQLWTSFAVRTGSDGVTAELALNEGEDAWVILSLNDGTEWSTSRASAALRETEVYWRRWADGLTWFGPRGAEIRRCAITFHLLSFAPTGALVAAPTTSLPERIGGERNYDYRYSWIRDVSLAMASLAMLGDLEAAERYMDWLAGLGSSNDMPLQVLYRIDGGTDAPQQSRDDLSGYRGSRPVLFGNHAVGQHQIDSFGYLIDCAFVYLQQGGRWKDEYWQMTRRLADYTAAEWREPGQDIWELGDTCHFVSSKVLAWVTLERAVRIAKRTGAAGNVEIWRREMEAIQQDVAQHGWSENLGAFRQHYEADDLDASALLMAMFDFLPIDDPRLTATIDRIEERLSRDGLVFRFDPMAIPTPLALPMGEAEGAFLPCTFWLAAARAKQGHPERAEAILATVERTMGELGLIAEEMDPRTGAFIGNTPLLFSHAEYLKAVLALAKARPTTRIRLMASQAVGRLRKYTRRIQE